MVIMDTQAVIREHVRIPVTVRDGVAATIYKPSQQPVGVMLVHSATATPQGFYRAFAEYAAAAGLLTITYDFRGTGLSGEAKAHPQIRMRDWIQQDVAAVADWAAGRYPNLPHYAIGHSVGGHALVLDYGTDKLSAAVVVSSHIAAIRTISPWQERLRVRLVLTVFGPLLTRLLGYMPGKKLTLGENIPAAALFEWSRWTQKREYFFDDPSMEAEARSDRVRIPVLAVGASDDLWASPKQMDRLTAHLGNAQVERRTVKPSELGLKKIGHHGLMRRGVGEQVWAQVLKWLQEQDRATELESPAAASA